MSHLLNFAEAAARRRWRTGIAGVIVVLATLALAPGALASGWGVQDAATAPFTTNDSLSGVSCSAANDCSAVGYDQESGHLAFLIEHYDGSAWKVQGLAGPASTTFSQLNGVSCPSASFCMAVGTYSLGSGDLPLVFTSNGSTWTQQSLPLTAQEHVDLSGVSCTSASFCMAVGDYAGGPTAAWLWNGSGFMQQRTGGFTTSEFTSVSCTSSTFCMAVGWTQLTPPSSNLIDPFTQDYNGSGWSSPNGALVPNGSPNSLLTGVSCVAASDCQAVGNYLIPGFGFATFGLSYNGSDWSQRSTPPGSSGAGFGSQGAVACASSIFCWAVGQFTNSTGGHQTLGDFWNGSGWQPATLPNPTGGSPGLAGVSCPSSSECEAVGTYTTASGQAAPFTEQYSFTVPIGCCAALTPHHFSLKVSGVEKQGATITAVLKKPKALELLVQERQKGRLIIVGLVSLGSHRAGTSTIHWNLDVAGRPLGKGTYEVSLRSVLGDILSPATPPGEITLTVKANRHVTVGK